MLSAVTVLVFYKFGRDKFRRLLTIKLVDYIEINLRNVSTVVTSPLKAKRQATQKVHLNDLAILTDKQLALVYIWTIVKLIQLI